jgi:nitrate reductase gamma subunit
MTRKRYIPALGLVLALALIWGAAGQGEASSSPDGETASCLECHAGKGDGSWQRDLGPHAELACQDCHQGVEVYPHENPMLTSCLECHPRHGRAIIRDSHAGVDCAACHLANLQPLRPAPGGPVKALAPPKLRGGLPLHRLVAAPVPTSCRRCHHAANQVGASAALLPAKGLLCLPCHDAGLGLTEWPSRIALMIFIVGLVAALGFWLSGVRQAGSPLNPDGEHRPNLVIRLGRGLAGLIVDGLFQRRLWRHSPGRGLIHALIFWPFAIRFLWGLTALVLETFWPQLNVSQAMLDKNHPAQALFFDLTGVMVLAGVAAAVLRRLVGRNGMPSGLPGPDWLSLGLLGGAVLLGFVVEGARLAMTGWPIGGQWAFAGWVLSFLFQPGAPLQEAYGWLWYAHVLAWCGFVAYLPFGRMFHLITAPLVLALRGVDAH